MSVVNPVEMYTGWGIIHILGSKEWRDLACMWLAKQRPNQQNWRLTYLQSGQTGCSLSSENK